MTKFCPECGTEQHSDNNRYCSNCGFDFSKITGNQNNTDFSSSDSINVSITESDESLTTEPKETVSSSVDRTNSSNTTSSSRKNTASSSTNRTKSTHTIYTGNSKSNNLDGILSNLSFNKCDGILSNLSFNKCFAAFAIILILLLIIGMLSSVNREPYSDDGITSFMENSHQNVPSYLEDSSSGSGLPSFLDDSDSDEDSYDYLSYGIWLFIKKTILKSLILIKKHFKTLIFIKKLLKIFLFIFGEIMKSAVLFSGGKDSVMALNYAIENGDDVKYLLSIKSENDESYMFHVPNIHMTELISQAVEIPLIEVKTAGVKEEELEDLKEGFKQLKKLGIETIYTGALFSTYQKSRIENLADELDIKAISPYWHKDPKEYMELVIDSGFKVIISGVFAYGLDEKWLGRLIDRQALNELEKISEKTYLHLAFEGGEAETLVIDGPIFKKRIEILKADIDWHLDSGTYNVTDARLIQKD